MPSFPSIRHESLEIWLNSIEYIFQLNMIFFFGMPKFLLQLVSSLIAIPCNISLPIVLPNTTVCRFVNLAHTCLLPRAFSRQPVSVALAFQRALMQNFLQHVRILKFLISLSYFTIHCNAEEQVGYNISVLYQHA